MAQVIWTQRSLNDLKSIGEYISKDSIKYSQLTIEKILSVELILSKFPYSGHLVPEFKRVQIRQIVKGSYRIIYQINDDKLYILTVLHSSRMLTKDKLI